MADMLAKSIPDNTLCFAIGDVHGCSWLYERMHEQIVDLIQEHAHGRRVHVIQLGDLIDRGADSIGCLDIAMNGLNVPGVDLHYDVLMGNHEQFLRAILDDIQGPANDMALWLGNGGDALIKQLGFSYGDAAKDEFLMKFRQAMGAERLSFLRSLKNYVRIGDVVFVHAGIDPHEPLSVSLAKPWHGHDDNHWAWIRYEFTSWEGAYPDGVVIVHGHTIGRSIDVTPYRVSVDIGSYNHNQLGAIMIDGNEVTKITVSGYVE